MQATTDTIPLSKLPCGRWAVVEDVAATSAQMGAHLAALGFTAGAMVRVLCEGRGLAVQLGDSRLVLRGAETAAILVALV